MATDLSKVNLQPLVDLLSKTGEETTEFKKAQSTGRLAQVAFWLGLAGIIGEAVAQSFGIESRIGMIAGAVVTVTGLIAKVLSSSSYAAARADTKQAAGDLGVEVAKAQQAQAVAVAGPSSSNNVNVTVPPKA